MRICSGEKMMEETHVCQSKQGRRGRYGDCLLRSKSNQGGILPVTFDLLFGECRVFTYHILPCAVLACWTSLLALSTVRVYSWHRAGGFHLDFPRLAVETTSPRLGMRLSLQIWGNPAVASLATTAAGAGSRECSPKVNKSVIRQCFVRRFPKENKLIYC